MNKRYKFRLNQEDIDLFDKVVTDVEPLNSTHKLDYKSTINKLIRKKTIQSQPVGTREEKTRNKIAVRRTLVKPLAVNDYAVGRVPGLDRKTALRLKKGRFHIDYRLDLHGLSQKKARDALELCIFNASHRKYRALLIITGKGFRTDSKLDGYQSERGVLRKLVPFWLIERPLSESVLAFSIAQPEHGGSGAYYVLLKRNGWL
jgi:DNA-nicking Smr family endonuclease